MRLERRVLEREGFMQYFEKQRNALIFRQDGETVRVEPWQKDSLRVRGTLLSEIEEGSIALLDPEPVEAEIELVDELKATIKNGKIQAAIDRTLIKRASIFLKLITLLRYISVCAPIKSGRLVRVSIIA